MELAFTYIVGHISSSVWGDCASIELGNKNAHRNRASRSKSKEKII